MNLILLDPGELGDTAEVTLADTRGTHLREVLKVTPGQSVRVGLIDGPLGSATVTNVGGRDVTLRCRFEAAPPPPPRVDLLLAVPRPKVLRRLWAQLAAMGVGRIILTNAARVERNYFDTHVLTEACYRPLLIEGLQQARDTCLPQVSVHRQFRVLVEDHLDALVGPATRLVADPGAVNPLRAPGGDGRVLLAVGPEGGWNSFELERLQAHGFQPVAMGPRTLRVDTACIALLALVNAQC